MVGCTERTIGELSVAHFSVAPVFGVGKFQGCEELNLRVFEFGFGKSIGLVNVCQVVVAEQIAFLLHLVWIVEVALDVVVVVEVAFGKLVNIEPPVGTKKVVDYLEVVRLVHHVVYACDHLDFVGENLAQARSKVEAANVVAAFFDDVFCTVACD